MHVGPRPNLQYHIRIVVVKKLFTFIFLCSFCPVLFAADAAGTVLFAQNSVMTQNNFGGGKPLARGASFYVGDTIVTGEKSKAQIKYTNGTLVTLSENTSYKVITYEPDNKDLQNEAYLSQGKMHSITENQEKAIVKTPVVALAILGSEVEFTYDPATNTATANVKKGSVQVLPNGEVMLPGQPNHFKEFSAGDAPPADTTMPPPIASSSPVVQLNEQQVTNIAITAPETSAPIIAPFDPCGCPPDCPPLAPPIIP